MKLLKVPYLALLVGPAVLFGTGILMNALVMAANGGTMPVLWPGGCTPGLLDPTDPFHSCMVQATHLKWLSDWVILKSVGIASPGDFLEWASDYCTIPAFAMWLALIVKKHNDAK